MIYQFKLNNSKNSNNLNDTITNNYTLIHMHCEKKLKKQANTKNNGHKILSTQKMITETNMLNHRVSQF